ncbi:hypothetical protein [Enterococcus entomosocium]|uniref:hypothetical protein n=1 Tax=Enterococcus entomosocium TaxID=3034352 RepID=UPI003D6B3647
MDNEVIIYLVSGFVGGLSTQFISKNNLRDSLDTKSGWRKELFNIASKDKITLDDVYRLKAAIRLSKHTNKRMKVYSFKFMTNVIYNLCDEYIDEYENDCKKSPIIDNYNHREIIRICARYLLKYHWDYLSSFTIFRGVLKDSRLRKFDKYAEESCKQIQENYGKINCT